MSQKSSKIEGSAQAEAGDQPAFDDEDWKRRLYELNAWTSGPRGERLAPAENARLPGTFRLDNELEDHSDPFAQARLQAALARWHGGKETWNAWATAMWGLREKLEAAGLWANDNDKAADEQRLFLHHASVEFDHLGLPGSVDFSQFLFPGNVSFRGTRFGDKEAAPGDALFGGAQFHGGDARFGGAQFHGGDARFGGAQFHGGDAWFGGAQFHGGAALFGGAQFHGGDARFGRAQFHGGDAWFGGAQFHGGAALFDGAQFHGGAAWFGGAQFHGGAARFGGAQFHGGAARFGGAQFHGGDARFGGAQFHDGAALFGGAQFHGGDARFDGTQFGTRAQAAPGSTDYKLRYAYFVGSEFKKAANFERCQINSQITFARARFDGTANFKGINSNVGFTLSEAYFHRVPDFTESGFHRPPRLDDVEVRPTWFGPVTEFSEPETWREHLLFWRRLTWNRDAPAKFRELKRFAIESQDGRSELAFHAEEIRSARWIKDKPWRHPTVFTHLARKLARKLAKLQPN